MATLHAVGNDAAAVLDDNIRRVALGLLGLRKLNRSELAGPLGLSRDQALDRLRGDKRFEVIDLVRMAEYFGVGVDLFVAGPDALFPVRAGRSRTTDEYAQLLVAA